MVVHIMFIECILVIEGTLVAEGAHWMVIFSVRHYLVIGVKSLLEHEHRFELKTFIAECHSVLAVVMIAQSIHSGKFSNPFPCAEYAVEGEFSNNL
jgi:hypothetical protein